MDKMNNTGTTVNPKWPVIDSLMSVAGSFALLGAKVPRDAGVAAKLRKAGAIILGKTNLSQWANFRSNNSTSS